MEHAIETLETTNQKLKLLINQHRMEPNLRVDPLGMVLNGVVDAAVSGGIANYKVSILTLPGKYSKTWKTKITLNTGIK